MAKLELVIYPDPILKQSASPVVEFKRELHQLVDSMAETMYHEGGVGLAANQVGVLKQVTVIDISKKSSELREFINPKIISREGKASGEEGCLSIPGYRDIVERSATVTVQALDRHGKEFELEADGLLAVALQHEIDHLNGVLFIDHLSRLKREMFKKWLKRQIE